MSDLIDERGRLLISPGDLWDKLTILQIKKDKQAGNIKIVEDEEKRTTTLLDKINELKTAIDFKQMQLHLLLKELQKINKEQWDWEDKVRQGDLEAAQGARECNSRRVQCKNEINKLYNFPFEQKCYRTK